MGKILVFGSSNADMILKTVNIPQKGETARCEDYKNAAGGKGANQACACAKLGADTVFLSAVGSDQFADMVLSSLRAAGTDVSRLCLHNGGQKERRTFHVHVDKQEYSDGLARQSEKVVHAE